MEASARFKRIFNNKGNIGPIAEKAKRNFEHISRHRISKIERIHYFCIGHAFRNIDKSIFKYELDEVSKQMYATQYKRLLKNNFTFTGDLNELIENIRNCNSHYVHTFDKLNLSNNIETQEFIKEAFEFSAVIQYLKENNLSYLDFEDVEKVQRELVHYLAEKFFPNIEYQKTERDYFVELELKNAIDYLLFIKVDNEFKWQINEEHFVFKIKTGKYLSHEGQLYVLGLFLYKDEAEQLISKIKGFKRSDDNLHYKRDIFTFFSKKYSSQDIHSEEKYSVRFRDIIQYLSHYPSVWNRYIEPERTCPEMVDVLEKHIIEKELFRSFPYYSNTTGRDRFLAYAVNELFKDKLHLFNFENLNFSVEEVEKFDYEINVSPELKGIHENLKEIGNVQRNSKKFKEKRKLLKRKRKLEAETNPVKYKLQERIEKEMLVKSYGRNNDRFMDFAIRFLAEENYFGTDAEFKIYKFYSGDEQEAYLQTISQKEKDKLKYHNSRIVHYCTMTKHLDEYPGWDTPFVVENNAFQVIVKLKENEGKLFSIQRGLIVYLLEDAFFITNNQSVASRGKELLKHYYFNSLLIDFEKVKDNLSENYITALHRKLLPKRLLYSYQEPQRTKNFKNENPFKKILKEAERQEEHYGLMLKKAVRLNLEDEFLAKNKGKQFKLRFIKKAWHVMFFKNSYQKQAQVHGHHKSFHITKEEFNDFSKWMYVFDEVPQYKRYLSQLFEQKNFFDNEGFKYLFNNSTTFEEIYTNTKAMFKCYIESGKVAPKKSGEIENYNKILSKDIVYINISHFISYLFRENRIVKNNDRISFNALENTIYLVSEYYYKEKISSSKNNENKELFNKLRKRKLEDALLYELAFKYLHVDKSIKITAKTHVDSLLTDNIIYHIKDSANTLLYSLEVSFNKIESLAVLIQHKTDQQEKPENKKTSFLTNLYKYYLDNYKKKSVNIKKIAQNFKTTKLKFEELNMINNDIISSSVKLSRVLIELEKYYILKYKTEITSNKNHIAFDDIKDESNTAIIEKYIDHNTRNKVFHFGVPEKNYNEIIKQIEKKFIDNEIDTNEFNSFDEMGINIKTVCKELMKHTFSDRFGRSNNKTQEQKSKEFENRYFKEVICKKEKLVG